MACQGRRNGDALRGHCPLPFGRGATGAQVPLHNRIKSNFMIIMIDLKQIYCSYSCTHKIQKGFL